MKPLRLSAQLQLSAGGKTRRFKIVAYTGGTLRVSGFALPVVLDLTGLQASGTPSILIDHDDSAEATVGQVADIQNDGRQLVLSGPVTGEHRPRVQSIIVQADAGHQWQASVGCLIDETALQTVQAGQTVVVNGQNFTGPVYVSRRSDLRETSILSTGADSSTSVNLAAKAAQQKEAKMDFEDWLAELGIVEADLTEEGKAFMLTQFDILQNSDPSPSAGDAEPVAAAAAIINLRASAAKENRRIAEIQSLTVGSPLIAAKAIAAGWSPQETELHMLKNQRRHGAPDGRIRSDSGSGKVLSAALALNAGVDEHFVGKHYNEEVMNRALAKESRDIGIHSAFYHVLQAAGKHIHPGRRFSDETIRDTFVASRELRAAGFSTVSLPGIFGDVQNKAMLQQFQAIETLAEKICARTENKDFKPGRRYRLTGSGEAVELAPGGHIKHIGLSEETFSGIVTTKAAMIAMTRTDIVNDDLGALTQLPQILGRMCALAREKAVFTALLGNANSFFHADNSNYIEGAGTALSITSLAEAVQTFRQQTDQNGDPVLISPAILLAPPELEVTADNLIAESNVVVTIPGSSGGPVTAPARNPHGGKYELAVSPYLSNASYSGYSTTAWFLFANPTDVPALMLWYLDGNANPVIEEGELDFSQLGLAYRCVYDFGVSLADHRGALKSKGAA